MITKYNDCVCFHFASRARFSFTAPPRGNGVFPPEKEGKLSLFVFALSISAVVEIN